jgi:16S rRNA (guanine527-N7)-methyltransferase
LTSSYRARFPEVSNPAWDQLELYGRLLADVASPLGLIGFDESNIATEIVRSLLLVDAIKPGQLVDVGSGAGLPGVPLAIALGTEVIFIDRKQRACRFLEQALRELRLGGEVICRSAEEASVGHLRESADFVVARAVAPAPIALAMTAPLCAVGGRIVLTTKGSGEATDEPSPSEELGIGNPTAATLERGIDLVQHVLIIDKLRSTSPGFPRQTKRRKA